MATPCLSMDTVPHSTLHTCTHSHSQHNRPHSHTVPSPLIPHTAPGLHECMHAHTCLHLEVGVAGRGSGGRREEGSCPYLDLHLDLQVGPVDGEQRAVRAGGAQLPGTVGHVPVAVSQEDQWGERGDLAGEGALVCRGRQRGLHFRGSPHLVDLHLARGGGELGELGLSRHIPPPLPLPTPNSNLHIPSPSSNSNTGICSGDKYTDTL